MRVGGTGEKENIPQQCGVPPTVAARRAEASPLGLHVARLRALGGVRHEQPPSLPGTVRRPARFRSGAVKSDFLAV